MLNPLKPFEDALDNDASRARTLMQVVAEGEAEIAKLLAVHENFESACRRYYSEHDVIAPHDVLHPDYFR